MAQFFFGHQTLVIAGAAALVALISFWFAVDIRMRWARIFGKKPIPDGALLKELVGRIAKSEARLNDAVPRLAVLEQIAASSIQKVGFLRYNPFGDTGGDQSFSLALLDHGDNGFLVTALYSRDGTRVYAKAVRGGQAKQQLSGEEQRVLEEAVRK